MRNRGPAEHPRNWKNWTSVFLTGEQIANYYEGYSNSFDLAVVPLLLLRSPSTGRISGRPTGKSTRSSAKVRHRVGPDDIVWVQDYQLMLLPGLLREHHAHAAHRLFPPHPVPSYELFRILPERQTELLRGVLAPT